ncbi:hypothetical protein ES703_04118 [subsurface metagenome]
MVAGDRRYGHPRTDEERRERHLALYGTEELPERGTGLSSNPGETNWLTWILITLGVYFIIIKK